MRSIALVLQALLAYPGLYFGFLNASTFLWYAVTVLLIGAFNSVSIYSLRRRGSVYPLEPFLHLSADLVLVSTLLFLSGGFLNPLWPILFLHSALGGIFLTRRWGTFFFLELMSVFCFLNWYRLPQIVFETNSAPRWVPVTAYSLVALLIWQIALRLRLALTREQEQMMRVQENRSRLDRLRAIGALTASLAHEFATPLNTIKMRIDRIERNGLRDLGDNVAASKLAIEQCEQSLRSMISAGVQTEDLQVRPVVVSDFLRSLTNEWQQENQASELTLGIEPDCHHLRAEVAIVPLGQAIFDLLDNAAEASEKPEVKISVTKDAQHQIVCRIEDNGRGFSEPVLQKFGESFVTTKSNGTGLGLSNAMQIFHALGGSLSAENLPAGGARVTWTLPISEAA